MASFLNIPAPAPFYGQQSEDVLTFISNVETWCQRQRLDSKQQVAVLGLLLKENAFNWYYTQRDETKGSFQALAAALKERYGLPPPCQCNSFQCYSCEYYKAVSRRAGRNAHTDRSRDSLKVKENAEPKGRPQLNIQPRMPPLLSFPPGQKTSSSTSTIGESKLVYIAPRPRNNEEKQSLKLPPQLWKANKSYRENGQPAGVNRQTFTERPASKENHLYKHKNFVNGKYRPTKEVVQDGHSSDERSDRPATVSPSSDGNRKSSHNDRDKTPRTEVNRPIAPAHPVPPQINNVMVPAPPPKENIQENRKIEAAQPQKQIQTREDPSQQPGQSSQREASETQEQILKGDESNKQPRYSQPRDVSQTQVQIPTKDESSKQPEQNPQTAVSPTEVQIQKKDESSKQPEQSPQTAVSQTEVQIQKKDESRKQPEQSPQREVGQMHEPIQMRDESSKQPEKSQPREVSQTNIQIQMREESNKKPGQILQRDEVNQQPRQMQTSEEPSDRQSKQIQKKQEGTQLPGKGQKKDHTGSQQTGQSQQKEDVTQLQGHPRIVFLETRILTHKEIKKFRVKSTRLRRNIA